MIMIPQRISRNSLKIIKYIAVIIYMTAIKGEQNDKSNSIDETERGVWKIKYPIIGYQLIKLSKLNIIIMIVFFVINKYSSFQLYLIFNIFIILLGIFIGLIFISIHKWLTWVHSSRNISPEFIRPHIK